jgi:hypothetical protein
MQVHHSKNSRSLQQKSTLAPSSKGSLALCGRHASRDPAFATFAASNFVIV